MQRIKVMGLSLIMAVAFSSLLSTFSYSADEGVQTKKGNVVCLIPDYGSGNVKPVIATGPCDGLPPHQHVLVTEDRVYSLQGLQDGLMKIEQNPNKTNVEITGKVEGSDQTGWVLFVN
ncbi:MAG: hypothetical protein RIG61_01390 [Deltaproteobacteria bacterium]